MADAGKFDRSAPVRIGHVSGRLSVGAVLRRAEDRWRFDKAVISRSARRLMSGRLHLPARALLATPSGHA